MNPRFCCPRRGPPGSMRMLITLRNPPPAPQTGCNPICQLHRVPDGSRPDNRSGDSLRPPFVSKFVNQVGKLALAVVIYDLFGRERVARVHPHVERPLRPETESALGYVDLHLRES